MSEVRSRLIYGFLEVCLLSLLADQPDYGLGLLQRLAERGLDDLPAGTLYPALLRLEKRGWVQVTRTPSTNGPHRKYYTITPAGLNGLRQRRTEWSDFVRIVNSVVEPTTHQTPR